MNGFPEQFESGEFPTTVLESDPLLEYYINLFDGVTDSLAYVAGSDSADKPSRLRDAATKLCRISRDIRMCVVELGRGGISEKEAEAVFKSLSRASEFSPLCKDDAHALRSIANIEGRIEYLKGFLAGS